MSTIIYRYGILNPVYYHIYGILNPVNYHMYCILNPVYYHIDGLVQDCSNSIANTLQLLQSCTKPSIYGTYWTMCTIMRGILNPVYCHIWYTEPCYDGLQLYHFIQGSVYVPSQWETMLHCNVVPHWLGACKNDHCSYAPLLLATQLIPLLIMQYRYMGQVTKLQLSCYLVLQNW